MVPIEKLMGAAGLQRRWERLGALSVSRRRRCTGKLSWTSDTKVRFLLYQKYFQTVFFSFNDLKDEGCTSG